MITHAATAAARDRIAAAFSPELIGRLGHALAETMQAHFQTVNRGEGNVLNWNVPSVNVRLAHEHLSHKPVNVDPARSEFAAEIEDRFRSLVSTILARSNNLHHPHYIGHQVPASSPIAALFDAVGSATNQVMAIYEMGPWASAVERSVVEAVGEQLGMSKGTFAGLITHGGSLANLTGLLTARNVCLAQSWESGVARPGRPPVMIVHADAHYGITRSAGILGLGTHQVIRAPLDHRRRMDPRGLDQLLTEYRDTSTQIVAVAACACATPIGAFDPLPDIVEVCRKHDVWLHVDAAHGGAAAFSDKYGHLVDGLAEADSIVCDAHKMMFVPALCAFVFYRNPAHRFEAFRQDAPYLFDPSTPGETSDFDSGLMTIECTKRAAAYGLWGLWSMFGRQLFADMVDTTFDLGRRFAEMLNAEPDFECLHEPQCNIVVFRYIPDELRDAPPSQIGEFNRQVRRQLIESGEFYIVQTNINGVGALRVTIINPLTTEQHLSELLVALRRVGNSIDQT
ncbi:MAG: aminotransferase class I/II-fold pyridoxal phosphate-dependent enzyme [Planctomycetaceae bacterium]|nr:aminotransferase class I/II-fold pyridoxal phosphate-dependent enzyme [Planctomycetaceae bacterium]